MPPDFTSSRFIKKSYFAINKNNVIMSKVQHILKELGELKDDELELILLELLKKVNQEKRIKLLLNQYQGIGKGLWNLDAQQYVDNQRNNDRV